MSLERPPPEKTTRFPRTFPFAVALAVLGTALVVVFFVFSPGPQLGAVSMLGMVIVGLVLSVRLPHNPVGWLVSAGVIAIGFLATGTNAQGLPGPLAVAAVVLATIGWSTGFAILLILLPLLFPDGRLLSPRWRKVVWLTVANMILTTVTSLLAGAIFGNAAPSQLTPAEFVLGMLDGPVSGLFMLILMVVAIVSLVQRYRRAGSELRQQLKWFIAAIAVAVVGIVPTLAGFNSGLATVALSIGLSAVPLGIGIAILKYRLYDIDLVINRALVFGALAAFITAIYIGIVVGIGTLIGSSGRPNLVLSIVATAVVAIAFQPVRERVQRLANRLVYGRRSTPYEVLSEFSERAAESYAGDEVLPRMARVLGEGTGAATAEVWLRSGSILHRAAAWPANAPAEEAIPVAGQIMPAIPGADRAVAVRHQGELLGALTVTKRRGESLTPIEEKLLADLAHQAGLVLKNVGLTADLRARLEDLRASRQRLVAAQDRERKRIERNLHDGAQQHLEALKVKLGLADRTAHDPEKLRATVKQLKADADEALETLRDLARGIYPPLLADQGLAAALGAHARRATVLVTVEADGIPRYPQEVEAAIYFCCLEALQNVQKYSGANNAVVRLRETDGQLDFEIEDDGVGFDPARSARGSGLQNVEDRISALGGTVEVSSTLGAGTTVKGSLPTKQPAAA